MLGKLPTIQAAISVNSSPRNIVSGDEIPTEGSIAQSDDPGANVNLINMVIRNSPKKKNSNIAVLELFDPVPSLGNIETSPTKLTIKKFSFVHSG